MQSGSAELWRRCQDGSVKLIEEHCEGVKPLTPTHAESGSSVQRTERSRVCTLPLTAALMGPLKLQHWPVDLSVPSSGRAESSPQPVLSKQTTQKRQSVLVVVSLQ